MAQHCEPLDSAEAHYWANVATEINRVISKFDFGGKS
jgi:hypothetical protein